MGLFHGSCIGRLISLKTRDLPVLRSWSSQIWSCIGNVMSEAWSTDQGPVEVGEKLSHPWQSISLRWNRTGEIFLPQEEEEEDDKALQPCPVRSIMWVKNGSCLLLLLLPVPEIISSRLSTVCLSRYAWIRSILLWIHDNIYISRRTLLNPAWYCYRLSSAFSLYIYSTCCRSEGGASCWSEEFCFRRAKVHRLSFLSKQWTLQDSFLLLSKISNTVAFLDRAMHPWVRHRVLRRTHCCRLIERALTRWWRPRVDLRRGQSMAESPPGGTLFLDARHT